MKRIFALSVILLFMVGCTKTVTVPLYTVQHKTTPVPSTMTEKTKVPMPLDEDDYMEHTIFDREKFLRNYIIKLYGVIAKQNNALDGIRAWSDQQVLIYDQNYTFVQAKDMNITAK